MASRTVLLRASWTASAWLVAAILGAGCSEKPQVGGKCPANRDGRLVCQDPTSALVCRGESWQALPCRGPQGCKAQGEKGEDVFCDHSIGTVGDRCLLDKDVVCGSDKTSVLVCSGGKFALSEACRGPKGCEVAGKQVRCDQSTAVPGEPCAEDKALGCAADAKAVLTCKDKKFTVTRTCKGPKGCVAEDKKIECDDTLADEGDVCDLPGQHACTRDGKSSLVCRDGKLSKVDDCKKRPCKIAGDKVDCQ